MGRPLASGRQARRPAEFAACEFAREFAGQPSPPARDGRGGTMLRLTTILVVCSLLFALPARSQSKPPSSAVQTGSAKVTGTVRDPGGKPAPGASVSLSTAAEIVAQTQADASGQY